MDRPVVLLSRCPATAGYNRCASRRGHATAPSITSHVTAVSAASTPSRPYAGRQRAWPKTIAHATRGGLGGGGGCNPGRRYGEGGGGDDNDGDGSGRPWLDGWTLSAAVAAACLLAACTPPRAAASDPASTPGSMPAATQQAIPTAASPSDATAAGAGMFAPPLPRTLAEQIQALKRLQRDVFAELLQIKTSIEVRLAGLLAFPQGALPALCVRPCVHATAVIRPPFGSAGDYRPFFEHA